MKATPSCIRVGKWTSFCCHCDLHQILTEDDVHETIEDMSGWPDAVNIWDTEAEALREIAERWGNGTPEWEECLRRAGDL